jgi:DeoR family transcriptional regulator, suf operon transcriptional repressor
MGELLSSSISPVPSGLDRLSPTEREIVLVLKREGELSADDLAEILCLSLSATRAALTSLRAAGFVQIRREGRGVGRKRFFFSLTPEGEACFPAPPSSICRSMTRFLDEQAPEVADRFWSSACDGVAERASQARNRRDPAARVETVAEIFREEGFIVDCAEEDEGTWLLDFIHCPFVEIVRDKTWMCEKELRIIEDGAAASLQRTKHMLAGDRICQFAVRLGEG